jgi:hypothetical protein
MERTLNKNEVLNLIFNSMGLMFGGMYMNILPYDDGFGRPSGKPNPYFSICDVNGKVHDYDLKEATIDEHGNATFIHYGTRKRESFDVLVLATEDTHKNILEKKNFTVSNLQPQ